jgi:hypothetical protein
VETPVRRALRLLSVHLNAGCREDPLEGSTIRDCESLAEQAAILARWAEARRREGVAFAILGDFNRRMASATASSGCIEAAAPVARPTEGLSSPCWADARGGRPFISHLLLGGPAPTGWCRAASPSSPMPSATAATATASPTTAR